MKDILDNINNLIKKKGEIDIKKEAKYIWVGFGKNSFRK